MDRVTTWLEPCEMRAWLGLRVVLGDVMASLDDDLMKQHGLHEGDYAVLVTLTNAEQQRLRMCDLASLLHLSPSGLTRRLDGLVRRGLVGRLSSDDDRRVILAVLTDAGRSKLAEAAPDHVASVRRNLFDHLSSDQVRQIGDALASLAKARGAKSS